MIQKQTLLNVIDNTGIKAIKCINIYKKSFGQTGDIILASTKQLHKKKLRSQLTLAKGNITKALIIRTKKQSLTTSYLAFSENSAIILNNNMQPSGTRLIGPIPYKLRLKKHFKIISLGTIFI